MRILFILTVFLLNISSVVTAQSAQIDSLKLWTASEYGDITKARQLLKQIRFGNDIQLYPALNMVYDSVKLKRTKHAITHSANSATAVAYEIEATLEWLDIGKQGINGKEARLKQIFSFILLKKAGRKNFNAELILLQDYTDNTPALLAELDRSQDVLIRTVILRALSASADASLEQKMLDRIDRKSYASIYPAVLGLLNAKGGAATLEYLSRKLDLKSLQRASSGADTANLEKIVKESINWRLTHPESMEERN